MVFLLVASARIHVTGRPHDFYSGPFCDVEVRTALDGEAYASQGAFKTRLKQKDVDGDSVMPEHGRIERKFMLGGHDRRRLEPGRNQSPN